RPAAGHRVPRAGDGRRFVAPRRRASPGGIGAPRNLRRPPSRRPRPAAGSVPGRPDRHLAGPRRPHQRPPGTVRPGLRRRLAAGQFPRAAAALATADLAGHHRDVKPGRILTPERSAACGWGTRLVVGLATAPRRRYTPPRSEPDVPGVTIHRPGRVA